MTQQHEFRKSEGDDRLWCQHCGCLYHPQMTATCLQRDIPTSELRPEPARRQFAFEDTDTIHARLVEREKERLARAGESAAGDCC